MDQVTFQAWIDDSEDTSLAVMTDWQKAEALVGLEVFDEWLVEKAEVVALGEGDWDIHLECDRDGEKMTFLYYIDNAYLTIE